MDKHSPDQALNPNLSENADWARALTEIEEIVGSGEPLVAAKEGPAKKRRRLAMPFGLSLLLASGTAIAVALSPASSSGGDDVRAWQSARR